VIDSTNQDFEELLFEQAMSYIQHIADCLALVPRFIQEYQDTSTSEYQQTAEQISRLESECDLENRKLSALIATASNEDIQTTLTHSSLSSGQLIELIQQLDEIANSAEQFARRLVVVDLSLPKGYLGGLKRLATYAKDAMSPLQAVFTRFIRVFCLHENLIDVEHEVTKIRQIEKQSDLIRDEQIASLYSAQAGPETLVFGMDLLTALDSVTDNIEDVTDRLCYISGDQQWIEIEPEVDQEFLDGVVGSDR